jgi:Fe-S cluster assembly protein SufD
MTALIDSLQSNFALLPAREVDALGLGELRRAAMLQTVAEGLPSQRNEQWKYTALRALSARGFVAGAETPAIDPAVLAGIAAPRLVFVNGRHDPGLSTPQPLPAGVRLQTLAETIDAGDPAIAGLLARRFPAPAEAFARVNSALALDGAVLLVDAGVRVDVPVHLVFVGASSAADIASHLRHVIVLGAGASLSLVEHHLASGGHKHLSNHLLDVELGAGAALAHARIQDEDAGATVFARTDAALGADALYRRVDLEMGAALSRLELNVLLQGERSRLVSGGAMLAGGRRHLDTRLGIVHQGRDTACDLLWRGLAADRARAAFHGGISILAGADGSDARLSNKNLLLSEGAEVDTQPVLQIHADEVKAAHGATVGRLDATALFYLRSRGIPPAQARALLTQAFCREALSSIGDAGLVDLLSPRLEARLDSLELLA